jgi:hypothetical protein
MQVKKTKKLVQQVLWAMGGQARKKKKPKTQGPTGVGRTSAVAKLVAYATATTTTTTPPPPPYHHHIATSQHRHTTHNTACPTKCHQQRSLLFSVLAVLQVTTAERQKTTIDYYGVQGRVLTGKITLQDCRELGGAAL